MCHLCHVRKARPVRVIDIKPGPLEQGLKLPWIVEADLLIKFLTGPLRAQPWREPFTALEPPEEASCQKLFHIEDPARSAPTQRCESASPKNLFCSIPKPLSSAAFSSSGTVPGFADSQWPFQSTKALSKCDANGCSQKSGALIWTPTC